MGLDTNKGARRFYVAHFKAAFYQDRLGFEPYAYKGLETGSRDKVFEVAALTREGREIPVAISLGTLDSPSGRLTVTIARDVSIRVADDHKRDRRALSAQLLLCAHLCVKRFGNEVPDNSCCHP